MDWVSLDVDKEKYGVVVKFWIFFCISSFLIISFLFFLFSFSLLLLVQQIIYPATSEASTIFSEITNALKRLEKLKKASAKAEKDKLNAASSLAKLEAR